MAKELRTLLLATDGSADAQVAANAAIDLATRTGAALHVAHIWKPPEYPVEVPHLTKACESRGQRTLTGAITAIQSAGGQIAQTYLRKGQPADEIAQLAPQLGADLIVMGSRGMSRVERLMLGSVSEGVMVQTPIPVLVLRGGAAAWPPVHVVVGFDGSPEGELAAELAFGLGRLYAATGTVVLALPDLAQLLREGEGLDQTAVDDARRRAGESATQAAARFAAVLGQPPEARYHEEDDPSALILNVVAERSDPTLIAVGRRGLTPAQRLRLGSTSGSLLKVAPWPLLVCPAKR
ncbi:MAG: universal stress protein [Chloroflexi bacterium]|nr:universal stress protein [Chloroflexota bacterium]